MSNEIGKSPATVANRRRNWRVRQMTGGRCFYCGSATVHQGNTGARDWLLIGPRYRMVREHVVPTSRAGDHHASNFVPACAGCNHAKGAFTLEEFRCLRAFQTGNMQFRFWGEHGPVRRRDWLVVVSPAFEREMVERALPSARDGYELRLPARGATPLYEPRVRPVSP